MRSSEKRSGNTALRSGLILLTISQIGLGDSAANGGSTCSIQISSARIGLLKRTIYFLRCMKSKALNGPTSQRYHSSRVEPSPKSKTGSTKTLRPNIWRSQRTRDVLKCKINRLRNVLILIPRFDFQTPPNWLMIYHNFQSYWTLNLLTGK